MHSRWVAFREQYTSWAQAQSTESHWLPQVFDIAVLDPFKAIIFTPSLQDADFDIDEIGHAAREWMDSRASLLFSLLPQDIQAAGDKAQENSDGFPQLPPLASVFFKKPAYLHGLSEHCMVMEICKYRSTSVARDSDDPVTLAALQKFTYSRPWNWDFQELEFDTGAHRVAKEVIVFFDLDPRTTTVSEMEESCLRFRCTSCDDSAWLKMNCHQVVRFL